MLLKKNNIALSYLLALVSGCLYLYVEYYLPRTDFILLCSIWVFLFGCSYYLTTKSNFSLKTLLVIGLLFRILLLFAIPPLSQDFNRFIWDGRMLFEGLNPYLTTPKQLIETNTAPIHQAQQLFEAMGMLNASNFTNYPPISQFGYYIAAIFGSKSIPISIAVMRIQLILADLGTYFIGIKILEKLKLPKKNILLYFLNPFIILELTGNLHYEPLMVFFLVWSLYMLLKNKWIASAILLGISINVKLLPLIFLPVLAGFFYKEPIVSKSIKHSFNTLFKKKRQIAHYLGYCLLAISVNIVLFLPFVNSSFLNNYGKTIGLWFKSFEFNASIYYIVRWVGYQTVGWNIIGTVGKILPIFVIAFVILVSLLRKNHIPKILMNSLVFSICIHLFLTTTVHPWYLSIPLALSVFTNLKYVYVWSMVIILSYSAYSNENFQENLYLVALEYLIVFGVLIYELIISSRHKHLKLSSYIKG